MIQKLYADAIVLMSENYIETGNQQRKKTKQCL